MSLSRYFRTVFIKMKCCGSQVPRQIRRVVILMFVLMIILYLPTIFYLVTSFNDSPNRESFNTAMDVVDAGTVNGSDIPRRIHQIWLGNRQPPDRYVRCASTWSRLETTRKYKYTMWTEELLKTFIQRYHPHFLPKWLAYQYTMNRVDTAKYLLLYTFGGIFADMDVCNIAPDPVLLIRSEKYLGATPQSRAVILVKGLPSGVNPEIMVSPPRHPFYRHCIRLLYDSDRKYVLPYLYMMCVGGPCFLTGAYNRYALRHQHILLLGYIEARGKLFSAVKGGEWYTWDSHVLISWIYFGLFKGHIVPRWLSITTVISLLVAVMYYCFRRTRQHLLQVRYDPKIS